MKKQMINSNVLNKFDYLYEKFSSVEFNTVEELEKLMSLIELEVLSCEYSPEFILNHTFLNSKDSDNDFEVCKFVIRPNIKYALKSNEMKTSFVLAKNDLFVKELITNLISWVSDYNYYLYLEYNIEKLNKVIESIIATTDTHWSLQFNIGEGILDISDTHIVLGISDTIACNINELGLFSEDDYWKNLYIEKFKNVLKECNRPYDILKSKSEFTNDLGIYNRKSINKLIRKCVKRRIECVRVGVGYLEDNYTFALIEKVAVSKSELKNIDVDNSNIIVIDNDKPTVIEKKEKLTKIVISYKLMPFEKRTNTYLDIPLVEYLKNNYESVVL